MSALIDLGQGSSRRTPVPVCDVWSEAKLRMATPEATHNKKGNEQ